MNPEVLRRLIQVAVPLAAALAGALGSGAADVTGARAWQEEKAQEIARAEIVRARVLALEAQQGILMELVRNCQGDHP